MPDETLTLAQVMTEVDWPDRSSLVRLLDAEETRTLLGVMPGPRPAYPRESLPVFVALRDAHLAGDVKPKTAPQFIRAYITGLSAQSEHSDITVSEKSNTTGSVHPGLSAQDMIQLLAAAIREFLADIAPVPEDRLITRAQAAEILVCSPRRVRRFVQPVAGRRGVWRQSDVIRAIRGMEVEG